MTSQLRSQSMKLLNKRQLREKTSLSLQTIDRLEKSNKFPRRVLLTQGLSKGGIRVAWVESEVDAWLEGRVRLRDSQT